LPSREEKLSTLIEKSEDPALWDNPEEAQKIMRSLSRLKKDVSSWHKLEQRAKDALELATLEDDSLDKEIEIEAQFIHGIVEQRELQALLSGPYDEEDAILSIHAGAGGTDSQDWAEMLQRMYLRWVERSDMEAEILSSSNGDEAGIKSVTIAISGDYVFGYLRSERGVHRLVRLSPFDSAHRRHTSFALVEVYPQVDSSSDVAISSSDIRIDTYRSAGAGGQNVQKNETAIRITHIPTGLVVTCQNERSQTQNKDNAMRVLRARLLDMKRQEQEEELAKLKGKHVSAEWGSQIRSYVLHPYQMVKDHRTNFEIGNTTSVLDGDLDGFIDAFLRMETGK